MLHTEIFSGAELAPSATHLIPSVDVSQIIVQDISMDDSVNMQQIVRGAYIILNTRLHMVEVTLSSMILKALNLVQLRSWRLFGNSLRSGLLQLKWKISYMQFGIFSWFFFMWLGDHAFLRYCIPMDSPRPLLSAELEFFNKGTGEGKCKGDKVASFICSKPHMHMFPCLTSEFH